MAICLEKVSDDKTYEYEYFSEETLKQATDYMVNNLLNQITRTQRKLEYLQSKEFKNLIRKYNRWTELYFRLAKTGRYTEKELNRIADKISDVEDTLRDHLAIDGWYIGKMNSVELPEV